MRAVKAIGLVALLSAAVMSVGGVMASWTFSETKPIEKNSTVASTVNDFTYGKLFIARTNVTGGTYTSANATTTADTSVMVELTLAPQSGATATVAIVFDNDSSISYYYNNAETLSTDNPNIIYTVTGVEKNDEIPSKGTHTVYLEFAYADGGNITNTTLSTEVKFNFTIDKEAVGGVVAETAVGKFAEILNDTVSYNTLTTAMDDRSGWNSNSVTYIGNVAGADSGDSSTINGLFGQDFMSMDLDGDGVEEPITMMVKRENLDGDTTTGDKYTYKPMWGSASEVLGVEMTIYITADSFDNVSQGTSMTVYASVYTKLAGSDEWTCIVELTKGTATANNYSGTSWGAANSFNTDTWRSEDGQAIEDLI